jgi:chromate transporter
LVAANIDSREANVTDDLRREEPPPAVSLREAFFTWCRVAMLSFGGPTGQIAVMHRIIVDEKKWISEERFLHALNYCMLLPGPEAQQLATYIGWLMHRTLGGLMAGILFILPGVVSILTLSILYATQGESILIKGLFFGLKPAVMAIVVEALLRIGKRVLKNNVMVTIATISFVLIFFFHVPFPAIIIVTGLVGYWGGQAWPSYFQVIKGHGAESGTAAYDGPPPSWMRNLRVSAICLTLWFGPLVLIAWTLGTESVFFQEGIFFSKAAVVTFGGAYAVLAYINQQAVENYRWLTPTEMPDGLAMAETTPGPLIMVVQFVGFMGGYRHPGNLDPLTAGILGSFITTWVTFVPCFYWIFLGAPYIERLRGNKLLSAALSAITAAVVGVILNLAVTFSLNTLFGQVTNVSFWPIHFLVPTVTSLDLAACVIAAVAFLLTFYWKRGMPTTLVTAAAMGIAFFFGRRLLF